MSRKKKDLHKRKKATKQPGSDQMMIDRDQGLYFMTACVHQGRLTTRYSGPKKTTPDDAREVFNDGLYRGIESRDDDGVI